MSCAPATNDEAPAADPVAARLERRLAALEEVREMSLRLARAFEARILAEDAQAQTANSETANVTASAPEGREDPLAPTLKGRDPVAAFASLARAVRLTVMLETRTEEALARWKAGAWGPGAEPAKPAAPRRSGKINEIPHPNEIVTDFIYDTVDREFLEPGDFDRLHRALLARLDDDGTLRDDRPATEVVAELWDEIRLSPNRVHWPWTKQWIEANWQLLHPGAPRPTEPAARPPPARVKRERADAEFAGGEGPGP